MLMGMRSVGSVGKVVVGALLGALVGLWMYGAAQAQNAPALSRALAAAQEKVRVARIRVTGATIFPAEDLRALVADAEGKDLTLAEIEALAGRITTHYRTQGYVLARAYVPPQEIRDGVVEIAVLEGRVGGVEVEGARWYSPDLLKSYVAPPKEAPVFHAGRHERGLLLLNDLPGLTVKSTLKPGADVGTTDVVLNVEKNRLLTGSVDVNNYGARLTGWYRFGFSLDVNNPLGFGDGLSLRGVISDKAEDVWFARGAYTVPVSMWGTKVGGAFTHVESRVRGVFRELGIVGTGDIGSVYVTHPFIRTQAFNLYGQAGFDNKNFETTLLGTAANRDRVRVFTVGGALDAIDRWRGLTTAGLTLHQGVPDFLGGLSVDDRKASRVGAGGRFTKLTMNVARLQQVLGPTAFFVRASGQWASTPLVSPEQFFVGGVGTVRGYPLGEILGDHGFTLTGEFRWDAPGFSELPSVQLFAFIDHGGVIILDPLPGQERSPDRTGTGAGLRVGIPNDFHFSVEYATPIRGPRPSDRRDHVIYFQAIKWF